MGWGRAYFAVQAVAGAAWWIAVFTIPFVRGLTLGGLDPVLVAVFDIPLFVMASALAALGIRTAAVIATGWTVVVAIALGVYAAITGLAGWGVILMIGAGGASVIALCLALLGRIPTTWIIAGPFAFRPAVATRARSSHVVATAVQVVLFWGLFLVVLPAVIAFFEQRWGVGISLGPVVAGVGLAVLVAASALGIASAIAMSTVGRGTPLPAAMPNSLVVAGPYRYLRNPMAAAGIVQGAAIGLALSSWLVVVYAVIGSVFWNYAVRPLEERDLDARFGEEYRRYRDAVRCWIPRLPLVRYAPADD